jgi:hydroxymethylpyrimidine/phosphomethylpyrimidine kinase
VAAQLEAVLDDLDVRAAKTGMLSSAEVVRAVVGVLKRRSAGQGLLSTIASAKVDVAAIPLVVDPVILAKDGSRLLSNDGIAAVRDELIPLATLVTPNVPEVRELTGIDVATEEDARQAGQKLRSLGCDWVLVKGGHLSGRAATDYLLGPDGAQALSSPRFPAGPYHGTGCALSSAITAYLAHGMPVPDAVASGRAFVQRLIQSAQPLGKGSLLLHPTSQMQKGDHS